MQKKSILIVGAGLAGLALYSMLNRKRFTVDIIERRTALTHLGYAVKVLPTGVRALRTIGILKDAIDTLGVQNKENYFRDKNGGVITRSDLRSMTKQFDTYFVATRARVFNLVAQQVDHKKISFGTELTSISSDGSVGFRDGSQKHYDLIVGADGVHSTVRRIVFPDSQLIDTGLTFLWAWIPRKNIAFPKDTGAMGDETHGLGFFDSGESDAVCVFFYLETEKVPPKIIPKEYPELWREHLSDFGDPVPDILAALPYGDQMFMHRDQELTLPHWHMNNVVLIGDAAHTRSVFTGSGTALYLSQEQDMDSAFQLFEGSQKERANMLTLTALLQPGVDAVYEEFFKTSLLFKK